MFFVYDITTNTFVHAADNETGAKHAAKLAEIKNGSGSAEKLTRYIVMNADQAIAFQTR